MLNGHLYLTARQCAAVIYGTAEPTTNQVRSMYYRFRQNDSDATKKLGLWIVPIEVVRHDMAEQKARVAEGERLLAELIGVE